MRWILVTKHTKLKYTHTHITLFGVMGMPDNGNDCIICWDILETTELYTLVKMMHFMLCEYNLSKKNQCVYIYIWIYNIYIINIYITIIPQGGETSESFQIVRKANCLSLGIQNLNTITGTTVIYLSNVNI